eukprot:TRINITY_DN3425_c0_g1_i2.p1 TRINITY_DN3425_c0_g1~~TRINITY_DN3425_c0_g1_i2.p1  ORF type:complete len:235 (+),score=19.43 TRINITY_DN3425_c0_g1_i2:100-804(+)
MKRKRTCLEEFNPFITNNDSTLCWPTPIEAVWPRMVRDALMTRGSESSSIVEEVEQMLVNSMNKKLKLCNDDNKLFKRGIVVKRNGIACIEQIFLASIWPSCLILKIQEPTRRKPKIIYIMKIASFDRLAEIFGWANLVTLSDRSLSIICPRGYAKEKWKVPEGFIHPQFSDPEYNTFPVVNLPLGRCVALFKLLQDTQGRHWGFGYRTVHELSDNFATKKCFLFGKEGTDTIL